MNEVINISGLQLILLKTLVLKDYSNTASFLRWFTLACRPLLDSIIERKRYRELNIY